jgi:ATP-dependent exoDNAse (exonuclease V) beta subunit
MFKQNPKIKEKYQKKFKGVLIDEFQDTDKLQIDIVKDLSENADLIIFGDPKQCIYEWRHANLEDYLYFVKDNFSKVDLDICFRSNIDLIGFFNLTFCKDKYDFLNKDLKSPHLEPEFLKPVAYPSSKDPLKNENPVYFIKTDDKKDEYIALVEIIKKLKEEGYKYQDILVLFRSTSDTEKYLRYLKINNIPFVSYLESNFYKSQEILTVLNLLRLIQYPENQLNVISVLKSPIFNFSDQNLLDERTNLSIEKIKELEPVLEISKQKENKSLSEIIFELFEKLKIFEIFSIFPDGKQKIANLQKLIEYSEKLERENFNLRDFINFLEENRETREDEGILIEDENFIKIMTMHKSKGLESKVVIIPNLSKKLKNTNDGFFTIDGELMVQIRSSNNKKIAETKNFDEDKVKEKKKKEEKRLLYVAMTRAKEKIVFIGSKSENAMKEIEKIIDYVDNEKINVEIKDVNTKQKLDEIEVEIKVFKQENVSLKEHKEKYWVRLKEGSESLEKELENLKKQEEEREKDYEKSISAKRFTTVSERMKESNEKSIIESQQIREVEEELISSKQNISIQLGILIHKILEKFSFQKDKKEAKKELYNLLNTYINDVTEEYKEKIKEDALRIIDKFLNSEYFEEISNSNILFREMPFTLKEKDIYVEGVIDLVYEKDGKIVVLDYKTGKDSSKEKIEKRYKIQADYYKKAVKNIFPDKEIEFKFALLG